MQDHVQNFSDRNLVTFAEEHHMLCLIIPWIVHVNRWFARGPKEKTAMPKFSCFYRHWSFPFVQGMTLITPYSPLPSKWSSFSQQEQCYNGDNWQRYDNRRHDDSDYWQGDLVLQRDMSGNEWNSWRCGRRRSWYRWNAETGFHWNKETQVEVVCGKKLLTVKLHLLKHQKQSKGSHHMLKLVFPDVVKSIHPQASVGFLKLPNSTP